MARFIYFEHIEPLLAFPIPLLVSKLHEIGILKNISLCLVCSNVMPLKSYSRKKDQCAFRCMTLSCSQYNKYFSVRKYSIFEKCRFCSQVGIKILWKWLAVVTEANIMIETGIYKDTLVDFYDDLRFCCTNYFVSHNFNLGGDGIVCQIDESLFRCKPKYHRGRASEHEILLFGIAITSYTPARFYMEIVKNWGANTLLPIIDRVCRPGSIIYSDKWHAFNGSSNHGFEHYTVNHSMHFVDPSIGVNTQAFTAYWSMCKLRVKKESNTRRKAFSIF